ncbi:MAG: alpha/beta hydrolase [Bacteroidales bacterium]|nr:alpha/beta hydrolase [Bacteroidales bacterium]
MKFLFLSLSLLLVSNIFALNPLRQYAVKPSDFGLSFEELKIATSDGLKLNAWYFPASQTSYKIMVLSDDGNGNMSDLMEHVSIFLSLGYHVLTYDYRGYGASSDFEIKPNFYIYAQFQKDLNAVIDYLKKERTSLPKIHLYGIGIGAGLSIAVAANRNLGTVIADSPYTTLELAKQRIKEASGQDVLLPLGYNKNEIEPKYALETKGGQLNGVMFIVGENDKIYTPKDIKELAKIRSAISTIYTVKNSNGENNLLANKEKYLEEIKKFLKL